LVSLYPAYTPTPTRAAFFNLLFNFDFGFGVMLEDVPESFGFGLKTLVILSFIELPEPLELGLDPLGFGFKIFVILVFIELPEPLELEGLEPMDEVELGFGFKAFVILVFNELPEPLELELGLEPLDELELGLGLEPLDELELGLELELEPPLFLA